VQERPRFLTRFDAGDGGMSEAVIVQKPGLVLMCLRMAHDAANYWSAR
jgi:hypothetical protein